jgi:acyl-coenzyme A thioesterase PaaI-like protein
MTTKPIQDFYPDNYSHCYGCGRLNDHGLHIKSCWDGEKALATFQPRPYHTAIPGYVYGGLIASLIDCHATGTAAAASYERVGKEPGEEPAFRFVTGTLNVRYLRPTPIDGLLELQATVREFRGRKVIVDVTLSAQGEVCATGEVITFQIPEDMKFNQE